MSVKIYYPESSTTPKVLNRLDEIILKTSDTYLDSRIKIVNEAEGVLTITSPGAYDCTDYATVNINVTAYAGEYSEGWNTRPLTAAEFDLEPISYSEV